MIQNVSAQSQALIKEALGKKEASPMIERQENRKAPQESRRIEEIKASIAEGSFRIDLKATAEKMAEALKG